jgi:hypothetical protein
MAEISLSMRASVSRKRWSVVRSRAADEAVQVGGDGVDAVAPALRLDRFSRACPLAAYQSNSEAVQPDRGCHRIRLTTQSDAPSMGLMARKPSVFSRYPRLFFFVAAVLPAAVFYCFPGSTPQGSYVLGLVVVFVLFLGWLVLSFAWRLLRCSPDSRVRCSPDSRAVLQRLAGEIRTILLEGKISVLQVEGIWLYSYPKVIILCESDNALRQLNESGLLSRITSKVGDAVKHDPTFGRNRESFDEQQGILATAKEDTWGFYYRHRQ